MASSEFESMFNDFVKPVLQDLFGVTVLLARGHLTTDEFTARRGDREHSAIGQDYGLEVTVSMRDFLLPVTSLVIDGETIEPRTGDRIHEGDEVFEIQPPDSKKPSVELQAGGYDWLVHTKRVKKQDE